MTPIQKLPALLLLIAFLASSCCKNTDESFDCPNQNDSTPLILGLWNFTGTFIDGDLFLEPCDLKTTLEVTDRKFIYTSFFGTTCEMSADDPVCYKIENGIVTTSSIDGRFDFQQEIVTLDNNTMVLKTISGNSSTVVTENWER